MRSDNLYMSMKKYFCKVHSSGKPFLPIDAEAGKRIADVLPLHDF